MLSLSTLTSLSWAMTPLSYLSLYTVASLSCAVGMCLAAALRHVCCSRRRCLHLACRNAYAAAAAADAASPTVTVPSPGSTDTTPMGWVNTYARIGIIPRKPFTVALYVCSIVVQCAAYAYAACAAVAAVATRSVTVKVAPRSRGCATAPVLWRIPHLPQRPISPLRDWNLGGERSPDSAGLRETHLISRG